MKHRLRPPEQDDLLRPRLVDTVVSRCPLKGSIGDALCAYGYNIRKIPAHLRALLVLLIGVVLELIRPAQDPQTVRTAV